MMEPDWDCSGGRVAGVDEAGRGPLAGPVVAAAVILDPDRPVSGLRDSKQLSPSRRETLYEEITGKALAWAVGRAEAGEIDELGIGEGGSCHLHAVFNVARRSDVLRDDIDWREDCLVLVRPLPHLGQPSDID